MPDRKNDRSGSDNDHENERYGPDNYRDDQRRPGAFEGGHRPHYDRDYQRGQGQDERYGQSGVRYEQERSGYNDRERIQQRGYTGAGFDTENHGDTDRGDRGQSRGRSWQQGYGGADSGSSQSHGSHGRHEQGGFSQQEFGGAGINRGQTQPAKSRGPHSGRGPKGYQRSDERIREEVCEILSEHGDIDASEIDVLVEKGEVTLVGTVDSRQTKRLAEQVLDHVAGLKDVHNQLRVRQSQGGADSPDLSHNNRSGPIDQHERSAG